MLRAMDISFTGLIAILAIFFAFAPSASASINYCSSQNTAETDAKYWTWQSNGWCSDQCRQDYAFAIVLTNNCWCSNYIPESQDGTSDCNDDCPGFPAEKCGNKDKNLYGYIQLNVQPSGTQGGSSPTSASQAQSSSPAATTLKTSAVTSAAPEELTPAPFTSIRVVTQSGLIVTETVVSQPTNGNATGTVTQNHKKSTPVGAIVGGVVGGLAALAAIVGLILFFLWKRRQQQRQDEADGQSGVHRNVSTMSKAGLLRGEKPPQYPPPIATTFQSSKRNSRMDLDNTSISPISASDRRSSRPYVFDQRLNPSAIMVLDNGSRGSFASLDDSHDYGRTLGIRNPDPEPRESMDVRSQVSRT